MYYEIYIDVVFIINLFMDYLLLRLVNHLCGGSATRLRSFLGALIGATGFCTAVICELYQNKSIWYAVHGVLAMLMLHISGMGKRMALLKAFGCWCMVCVLMGGILYTMLHGLTPFRAFAVFSILGYVLILAGIHIYQFWQHKTSHLLDVLLVYDGKQIKIKGLYDTGNQLYDSCTQAPVSVLAYETFKELLSEEEEIELSHFFHQPMVNTGILHFHPHFIPYHSVGNKQGMLMAVTLEKLLICYKENWITVHNPVIALSPELLSDKTHFQMIIHPDCILR